MARVTFDIFKNPLLSKVWRIPNTFEGNGFLKISNVTLAISGVFRRGLLHWWGLNPPL